MNKIENIGVEILEIFTEKQKYDEKYNSIDYTKAYALIDEYRRSLQMTKPADAKDSKDDSILATTIEHNKQKVLETEKTMVEKQFIQPQDTNYKNNSGSINILSTQSQLNETVSNSQKKPFNQRSRTEIRIAEKIRFKNKA